MKIKGNCNEQQKGLINTEGRNPQESKYFSSKSDMPPPNKVQIKRSHEKTGSE